MPSTLPSPQSQCCDPVCTAPTTIQVPGPAGANGSNGTNGTNGVNAYTTVTVLATMPGELASVTLTVANSTWMAIGEVVWLTRVDGTVKGYMQVTAVPTGTSVTLKNLKDTPSNAYTGNSAAGTINVGSQIVAGGLQGSSGTPSGAAGGDLKGTYPNPKVGVANTKGNILAGNGTDTVAMGTPADGSMLSGDATQATGLRWQKDLPVTGDPNVGARRVPRLTAAAGLPIPLEASKAAIADPGTPAAGALVLDISSGNSRGQDAVDLQVQRVNAAQVASGQQSVVAGGANNTASSLYAVVGGGNDNSATAQDSCISGGASNQATATYATVGGGSSNQATSQGSTVAGGQGNSATTNNRATIGGGQSNAATGKESTIAGGNGNIASGEQSAVGGGDSNTTSGVESTVAGGGGNNASAGNSAIGGGQSNTTSNAYACVPGGLQASADKYGQVTHASGRFGADGDAQASEVIWRRQTANNTPTEMFLNGDGATERATIANLRSWAFTILIIGRDSTGVSAAWKVEGAIQRNAGTTSMVAVATVTVLADGTGATWGVAGSISVTADNVNGSLKVQVTGAVATTIRWVAHGRLVEVGH